MPSKKPKRAKPKRSPTAKRKSAAPGYTLSPLQKNQYRTKLFGLRTLHKICPLIGAKALNFKVCNSPRDFSISSLPGPGDGRIIVRTDPSRPEPVQTMEEWAAQPRLNVYLEGKNPRDSEALVKKWMDEVKRKNPGLRFIVHRVRNLRDYERFVQLNVDLSEGTVHISTTKASTDKFRDETGKTTEMRLDDAGRIRRIVGAPTLLPEDL
jgi:hypothetical protein